MDASINSSELQSQSDFPGGSPLVIDYVRPPHSTPRPRGAETARTTRIRGIRRRTRKRPGLKREELVALNSTLLHELYFASLGLAGKPTAVLADVLARDFGSVDRWRNEFVAMGSALAGGSGWVLLVYMPRDRCLINQYASEHTQAIAGGIPILALDMYEHIANR